MTFNEVIEHFGSVAAVASKLGISDKAVYLWKEGVPKGRQWELQAITKGKLKADPVSKTKKAA